MSQTAAELSLLNSKALCVVKSVCLGEGNAAEGSHENNNNPAESLGTSPALLLDFESPPAANAPDPICEPLTELLSPHVSLVSASDSFLQKNTSPDFDGEKACLAKDQLPLDSSVNVPCEVEQLLGDESSSLNPKEPESAPDPEQESQTVCLHHQEVDDSTLEKTESPSSLPLLDPSVEPRQNTESCPQPSEDQTGAAAFMQILDSLQKQQMNTALCEKIRKVYGDLECEYCGEQDVDGLFSCRPMNSRSLFP